MPLAGFVGLCIHYNTEILELKHVKNVSPSKLYLFYNSHPPNPLNTTLREVRDSEKAFARMIYIHW